MTTMTENLQALSEEQIKSLDLNQEDLWYIKNEANGEELSGPYSTENLKQYLYSLEDKASEYVAANYSNKEEWKAVFSWEKLQRRKPQLVALATTNVQEHFYLLDNGSKIGPFTQEDVLQKLNSKELIYSDFISLDKGVSWLKIFELPQFDRRSQNEGQPLPLSPNDDTFRQSHVRGLMAVENNQTNKDMLLIFATSAKKKLEAFISLNNQEEIKKPKFNFKYLGMGLGFTCIVAASLYLYKLPKENPTISMEEQELHDMGNEDHSQSSLMGTKAKRSIASQPSSQFGIRTQSLHQNSHEHKVPVPITDSNPANYDDPPVLHDMAEPIEKTVEAPLDPANPPEASPEAAPEVVSTEPVAAPEMNASQIDGEDVREPASQDGGEAQPSEEAGAKEPAFNQEVEG